MGFWKNVDNYLKFRGIPRKELAIGTGIKSQTIDRAIQRDSEPKFIEGLKICRFLNVSFEEFLDTPITTSKDFDTNTQIETKKQVNLYRKYHDLIQYCENLPDYQQASVRQLAQTLAESAPLYEPSDHISKK